MTALYMIQSPNTKKSLLHQGNERDVSLLKGKPGQRKTRKDEKKTG